MPDGNAFPHQEEFPYMFTGSRVFPGAFFPYVVYRVGEADERRPFALVVVNDGRNDEIAAVSEKLYMEGKAPACVIIGVHSGWRTAADGEFWLARSEEYDAFSPDYGRFLTEELIPQVIADGGFPISADPDMRLIAGGSSGGMAAFTAAWFYPDRFRRIYLSSPAFLSICSGDGLVSVIRKSETRPFRIAMEISETEPDPYFGDLRQLAVLAESSFSFAGYDFKSIYCPGEDHCSRFHRTETLYGIFEYLWKDFGGKRLKAPRCQPRLGDIISARDSWKPCRGMPPKRKQKTPAGEYRVIDGKIVFIPDGGGRRTVAPKASFSDLREIALSADKRLLYAADAGRGCVAEYTVAGSGDLADRYRHGVLHALPDFIKPGALSICVDDVNRVYAATEPGIQCVTFNGLVEAIIDLPDFRTPVVRIEFGGRGGRWLYAKTADGRFFRRRMRHSGCYTVTDPPEDYMKRFVY